MERWQFGLSSFQGRDSKLTRFLAKDQHTQEKLLYFVNYVFPRIVSAETILF